MRTFCASSFHYLKSKILLTGMGLLVACQQQADVTHSSTNGTKTAVNTTVKQETSPVHTNTNVVFDIPALLPLTLGQVKAKLGRPTDELQANVMNTEKSLIYKKRNLILSVDYFIDTPKKIEVISFVNRRDTTTFEYLLLLGNLSHSSKEYIIDTLRGKLPGTYRGIAIRYNLSEADSTIY